MKQPNVITATEAAREKGCNRRTIYEAANRGELGDARIGRSRLIFKDGRYDEWQPQERGRRVSAQTDVGE